MITKIQNFKENKVSLQQDAHDKLKVTLDKDVILKAAKSMYKNKIKDYSDISKLGTVDYDNLIKKLYNQYGKTNENMDNIWTDEETGETSYATTPKFMDPEVKEIKVRGDVYVLGLKIEDFTYYVNFNEQDPNGNTLMYRNSDNSLASDNYFAGTDILDRLGDKNQEYIFIHPDFVEYLDEYRANYADENDTNEKININNKMKKFDQYLKIVKEGLDKPGKEDKDINNDGKVDKQDSYLAKRRATIKKNMKKENIESDNNFENYEAVVNISDNFNTILFLMDKKMLNNDLTIVENISLEQINLLLEQNSMEGFEDLNWFNDFVNINMQLINLYNTL